MSDQTYSGGEIFIVDDDAEICRLLETAISRRGHQVTCFADGASFLAAARTRNPACILLDVYIPGRSGLDILKDLKAQDYPAPILIISGQGDIPMAVDAIKHGAFDFIEKPFRAKAVAARVQETIVAWARTREKPKASDALRLEFPGRKALSKREGEVLAQLIAGASAKVAARELGISPRTVEIHRVHIMEKLGAKNLADLARIVMNERRSSTK
jgi:FixJ family two-component response regulator